MFYPLRSSTKKSVAAVVALPTKHQQRTFSKSISPSALNNHHQMYEYTQLNTSIKSLPLFDFFAQTKPQPSFKLGHGAAGFAKKRYNTAPVNTFSSYTSVSAQVGEDAYFRRSDAIGVADGIGGWSDTAGNKKKKFIIIAVDQS
jgi:hypothetical protein